MRLLAPLEGHPVNPDLLPAERCPKCGNLIVSTITRTTRGVTLSDRICANQHLSHVKWVA